MKFRSFLFNKRFGIKYKIGVVMTWIGTNLVFGDLNYNTVSFEDYTTGAMSIAEALENEKIINDILKECKFL